MLKNFAISQFRNFAIPIFAVAANAATGENVTPSLWFETPSNIVMRLEMEPDVKVFADSVKTEVFATDANLNEDEGVALEARRIQPVADDEGYYHGKTLFAYDLPLEFTNDHVIAISYQACAGEMCYLPQTVYLMSSDGFQPSEENQQRLEAVATLSGYASPAQLLRFLNNTPERSSLLDRARQKGGALLLLLAALIAGFSLNLTPCVLPLIPVNLAMIGRGAKRGAAFGLGIAVVFGALGLLSALTGTAVGFIQSSVFFNAGAAIVFCILALAMLDVINIDFSKFKNIPLPWRGARQGGVVKDSAIPQFRNSAIFSAFAGGMFSALLSGACVAPVLVSVLVLSAEMTGRGEVAGYILPFALGIGMGLPWPFIGGGVMTLPRAGKWMLRVKQVFALLFVVMAARYLVTAYRILFPAKSADDGAIAWIDNADEAFNSDKPVFVYLTADWCAACKKLSATTFKDAAVIDGCNEWQAFYKVMLPLAKTGLAATAILCIIAAWNDFLYALILGGKGAQTLTVAISSYLTYRGTDWGPITAAGSVVMLPMLLFSFFIQGSFVKG
ncbi:MAG: ABC transporter permease subunit, partial [Kiritimatiellaeota bacterium]|nr:ABC transporter permease subunit [Kiritimatiellota bacterium]